MTNALEDAVIKCRVIINELSLEEIYSNCSSKDDKALKKAVEKLRAVLAAKRTLDSYSKVVTMGLTSLYKEVTYDTESREALRQVMRGVFAKIAKDSSLYPVTEQEDEEDW